MTGKSLTERLAEHLSRPVDPATRARMRLHLRDWLGCVAGALTSPVAARLRDAEVDVITKAAWLGNVLEMDDVHRTAILHPGPVIWPTVLAGNRDMAATLDAAARGYEAMIVVGATFDQYHYAHWHNTATAGVFGAAAAAASLLDCDVHATAAALGLAGSVAGGLWRMRHEPVDAKQWHVAHAMVTGGSAAFYAAQGMTGPRFVLEGEQGLYVAMTEHPGAMALGPGWRIEDVSFKPWAACRHAHPAIDAALGLASLDGPILVATYRDALTFCDRPHPTTPHEAKFSLQHSVAVVAARGVPRLADFEPDAIAALADVRARVTVREDSEFSARFPRHYGARVTAAGGTVERIDTRGDPERPLSTDDLDDKVRALCAWGGADSAAVLDAAAGDDPAAVTAVLGAWL